jgi:3-oxoisoapionate decarboxylase
MTMDDKTPVPADRRTFLKTMGVAALAMGMPMSKPISAAANVRMGVDVFSLGQQGWTPFQVLDWAAKNKVQMLHFSEVRFLGSPRWQEALAPDNLKRIRDKADELKIDIEIGMRSLCPTSSDFANAQRNDPTLGTADEQIARMLVAAKTLRSPIIRCVLGTQADRNPPGIESHQADFIKVLKANRSRIMDAGVKLAIENHAGDQQARELKNLIEGAGPEYVGVCLDSGNPVWTIEDPHLTLETLAPYVLTSHMRDSYMFNSPQGTAVRWTRMGDGNMGMEDYIRTYVEKCPGKAVSLEVIVSPNFRIFNYRDPAAWALYKTTPAWEFARFLALCDKGEPQPLPPPGQGRGGQGGPGGGAAGAGAAGAAGAGARAGAGPGRGAGGPATPNPEALKRNQDDVEASVKWTQDLLAKL